MMWAALVSASKRPAILNKKHTDWGIKFLRWVPRSWTAFLGNAPRKIAGNATTTKPIPDPGYWWIGLPLYFAFQTKSGIHARIGFRWDDIDKYYNFTIEPFKRFTKA